MHCDVEGRRRLEAEKRRFLLGNEELLELSLLLSLADVFPASLTEGEEDEPFEFLDSFGIGGIGNWE